MEYLKELHELCKTISDAISESNAKIKAANGKLTAGDVDYIDKLTHTLKSIKATIAMMEDEEEYSNEGSYRGGGRSYRDGSYGSYRGGSYRGRMGANTREYMGRYSGERGYSRAGLTDELYELMREAPDEQTRREFERFINRIEYRD